MVKSDYEYLLQLAAAKEGFIEPDRSYYRRNPMECILNMTPTKFTVAEPVALTVVRAGTGLATLRCLYYVHKGIEQGLLQTKQLIVLAGRRETSLAECGLVEKAGFKSAETEYDMAMQAVYEVFGSSAAYLKAINHWTRRSDADDVSRVRRWNALMYKSGINVLVMEIDSSPRRRTAGDAMALAPDAQEIYEALDKQVFAQPKIPLSGLEMPYVRTYVVADDVWQPVEMKRARMYLPSNYLIYGSGPRITDRVYRSNATGRLVVRRADELYAAMKEYYEMK